MSERRPTPEQGAAIRAASKRVMVEAGAGTGKTGVMVERYCRLTCDEEVSPDGILAITFTDKAAAELRQRVRGELTRRAGAGSERARELLAGLGTAWITTIHGFCHRVLAAHPVAAGVDPRFTVLDPAETERAAREAFDTALEGFLAAEQPAREETVAGYGIDALRGMIAGAHAELRSRGAREPRLPPAAPVDSASAIAEARRAAEATLAELGEKSRWRPHVEKAAALLADRGPAIELDEIAPLAVKSSAEGMAEYCEAIAVAIARVAEAGEGGVVYSHAAELLERFGAEFAAVKERRRGIDFEDMQLLAAELLEQDAIGSSYRSRFSHLLIDEFQDTNRLQLRLVESLRGPRTSLVVVGDLLQSIYGFRHADLDVFREEREVIAADPGGEVIELSGNFRSRPEVIAAVNALGEELIGGSYRQLTVGALPAAAPAGPPVELLLTAKTGWEEFELEPPLDADTPADRLAEARAVALRLHELVDEGTPRGEIVVLLRAFSHLDAYEDALSRAGLRPYVVGGRGYWSQQQVSDVCALLAVLANPLDDQALLGALSSPACGVAPDTLWLLRAASGPGRHLWPALRLLAELGEAELAEPGLLGEIEAGDAELLRGFAATVVELRGRVTRLSLAELIDRAVVATGYDLAVLLKPAGEARFANVRKLMQLAAEFEAREGRDLRGLLDFLAFREAAADEAAAATAAEDHDGVRIMSVHRAKGLEFGVVAVPHLDRNLLTGTWPPLLTFGRGENHRIGLQLRRVGARSLNLFDHEALREATQVRDAEEALRLFHVAATRARERLVLSGIVREKASKPGLSTSVVERIVEAFGLDRATDGAIAVPAASPRPGLDEAFAPSEIVVRVNAPSAERAAELLARHPTPAEVSGAGTGPAPLLERDPPAVPNRPLSYSALSAYRDCGYRFQLERVFGLGPPGRALRRTAPQSSTALGDDDGQPGAAPSAREERTIRGRVVHALLEWSQANGWREPPLELGREAAAAEGLDPEKHDLDAELLAPVRRWIDSAFLREKVDGGGGRTRAEVPLLLGIGDTVLRGSIDLLVEREGSPPLVVDYKTDRLDGSDPKVKADQYRTQRAIYALAVAGALDADEVEVAYVFLERADEPVLARLDRAEVESGRAALEEAIGKISRAEFPVAEPERRDWELCRGCPALRGLCSGPSEP